MTKIPNKETIKAMKELEEGKGIERFESVDDLFNDLNLNDNGKPYDYVIDGEVCLDAIQKDEEGKQGLFSMVDIDTKRKSIIVCNKGSSSDK